jgi:hypothetical protein
MKIEDYIIGLLGISLFYETYGVIPKPYDFVFILLGGFGFGWAFFKMLQGGF